MTVVAFVGEAAESKAVIVWAGKFAASRNAELVIFFVPGRELDAQGSVGAAVDDPFRDETQAAVSAAVESVVRTKRARKGRIPRYAVSIRPVTDVDPVAGTVARLRVESPVLFVGAEFGPWQANSKSLARQIAARIPYNGLLLTGTPKQTMKTKRIVVATSDGVHDKAAVDLAAQAANVVTDGVTIACVEASVGEEAIQVGERHLRSLLRELGLEESARLEVKAALAEDWVEAIIEEATQCDLLLVGANRDKSIPELLEKTGTLVGVLRRATRPAFRGNREHAAWLLPQINPADYADLYEQLQTGSRWNIDFIFMLTLAAGIATLGLLQSSPAVVIGSMLLAPLMTPMIGMGLALNQGNAKLAQSCFRAIGRGFWAALIISIVLGWITPGSDLTPEVTARTQPNILDLLIALFSGAAAAYALARPSLVGTVAGVAIATALVPPLCSAGICTAYGQYSESIGALSLLVANVLAIILAAAATFRAMGLRALTGAAPKRFWVRHVVTGLTVAVLVMAIPLGSAFMQQVHEGKNAPFAFALTTEMRNALLLHVEQKPGVDIIFAGRAGIDRESEPIDIGIILSSQRPLPQSEADELIDLIRTTMRNPELRVKVACVADGWANETTSENHDEANDGGSD